MDTGRSLRDPATAFVACHVDRPQLPFRPAPQTIETVVSQGLHKGLTVPTLWVPTLRPRAACALMEDAGERKAVRWAEHQNGLLKELQPPPEHHGGQRVQGQKLI